MNEYKINRSATGGRRIGRNSACGRIESIDLGTGVPVTIMGSICKGQKWVKEHNEKMHRMLDGCESQEVC